MFWGLLEIASGKLSFLRRQAELPQLSQRYFQERPLSSWLFFVWSWFLFGFELLKAISSLMKVLSGWKIYQVVRKLVDFLGGGGDLGVQCPTFLPEGEIFCRLQKLTALSSNNHLRQYFQKGIEWWKHLDIAFSNKQFSFLGFFEFIGCRGRRGPCIALAKGYLAAFLVSSSTEERSCFQSPFGISESEDSLSESGWRGVDIKGPKQVLVKRQRPHAFLCL